MAIFVYAENINGVYKKAAFEAVSYAKAIADKLSQLDSKHKEDYQARAKLFTKEAKAITENYREKFNKLKIKK